MTSASLEQVSGSTQQPENPVVSVRAVGKRYGDMAAVLHDINLDVRRGEFLTLLGPSGSGKTTTLMLIAGFQDPTSGQILIDGKDVSGLPPYRRDLGVVFQNYALFPHMSVAKNVAFPLALRKISATEISKRVAEALELVHLGGFGDRRIMQLSGGQQQRVALARALVYRPKIILMDEPLGALDRALRDSMQREFRAIHRSLGMTFIYVTHDQQEALTMSDRIAVFDGGRIVQLDHPEAVYRRPASRFVATFLGESNLLPAEVLGRDGEMVALRLSGGEMVRIAWADAVEIGSQVEISIRQESVLTGPDSKNALNGILQDATFYGDHVRLVVRLGQDLTVVAKSNPVEQAVPPIGSPITIGIPERDFALIFTKPAKGK